MSFNAANISIASGYGQAPRHRVFDYSTPDTKAQVSATNYWDAATLYLGFGDIIQAACSDGNVLLWVADVEAMGPDITAVVIASDVNTFAF